MWPKASTTWPSLRSGSAIGPWLPAIGSAAPRSLHTPLSAGSPNFRGVADAKGNTGLAGLVRERRDLVAEWKAKDKQLIGARGNLRGSAIQLGPDEALVLFLDTQEIKLTVP